MKTHFNKTKKVWLNEVRIALGTEEKRKPKEKSLTRDWYRRVKWLVKQVDKLRKENNQLKAKVKNLQKVVDKSRKIECLCDEPYIKTWGGCPLHDIYQN